MELGPLWSHTHAVQTVTAWIEQNPDHQWTGSWWSEAGRSYVVMKKVTLNYLKILETRAACASLGKKTGF